MNAENNQSSPETLVSTTETVAQDNTPEAPLSEPTPKKRGRKKGTVNKPSKATSTPAQSKGVTPKKSKKKSTKKVVEEPKSSEQANDSAPKKRGRKKGSSTKIVEATIVGTTPKKRGRKKAAEAPSVAAPSDAPTPKKRGRKKSTVDKPVSAPTPSKRGRKKGVTSPEKSFNKTVKNVRTTLTKVPSKKELIKLQKEHKTDAAIAEAVGMSGRVIFNLRKKYGIISSYAKNEARNVEILKKKQKGWKVQKLSEKYGLSLCQIYKVLKKGN